MITYQANLEFQGMNRVARYLIGIFAVASILVAAKNITDLL